MKNILQKKLNKLTGEKKRFIWIGILALAAIIAVAIIKLPEVKTLLRYQKTETKEEQFKISEAGEILPPIPTGNQIYRIITNNNPKITDVTIDPLDAKNGEAQKVIAKVEDPGLVESVKVTIYTDNSEVTKNLTLKQGTGYNGSWETSYKLKGTYEKKYRFKFQASTKEQTSAVTITVR